MNHGTVIVGSSVGGVKTAQRLRDEGYDDPIVIIGAEEDEPYDKPPLSKQFLAGEWSTERISLLSRADAGRSGIGLRLGTLVSSIDLAGRRVVLADGERIAYSNLVIATGASARPTPWDSPPGVRLLRTLEDSRTLRNDLAQATQLMVIGAGLIGTEVAATANRLGVAVTIVDPMRGPVERVLGRELSEQLGRLHQDHGVETHFETSVNGIRSSSGGFLADLSNGSSIESDMVLAGLGSVPNTGWLRDSGLVLRDGVVCDEYSRAIGAPGVFAVGDVARWFHRGIRQYVRVEHWANASEQAACVAHNIVRKRDLRAHQPVEYVWSDQYDWKFQIVGRLTGCPVTQLVEGQRKEPPQLAVLGSDDSGRLSGAGVANWQKAALACRQLLAEGANVGDAVTAVEAIA